MIKKKQWLCLSNNFHLIIAHILLLEEWLLIATIEFSDPIHIFKDRWENAVECASLFDGDELLILLYHLFFLSDELRTHGELSIILEGVDSFAQLLELAQELLIFPYLISQFALFLQFLSLQHFHFGLRVLQSLQQVRFVFLRFVHFFGTVV